VVTKKVEKMSNKLKNTLPVIIGLLTLFPGFADIQSTYNKLTNKIIILENDPCRPEVEQAREMLENFILNPNLSDARAETGTTELEISQIQLLDNFQHENACQFLNNEYNETITKLAQPDNDPVYDVVFYKVGNFYFVVIVLAQPSDPDVVSTGLSFILIHDQNLNYISGYSG